MPINSRKMFKALGQFIKNPSTSLGNSIHNTLKRVGTYAGIARKTAEFADKAVKDETGRGLKERIEALPMGKMALGLADKGLKLVENAPRYYDALTAKK